MKACYTCKETKALSEFYPHPQTKDGHLGQCKKCKCAEANERRRNNPNFNRDRDLEKVRAYNAKWRAKYPKKKLAHNKLTMAVSRGVIKRKDKCEDCGTKGLIQAHHDDYAKPLDVRWLCTSCHGRWHRKNGPGLNG